jgi:hypothetical protein
MPLALVTAVAVGDPLNAALAPATGAENVTVMLLSGLLPASFTTACNAVTNAVLTVALCGVPAEAATLAGRAAVLESAKLAAIDTPGALAVTV